MSIINDNETIIFPNKFEEEENNNKFENRLADLKNLLRESKKEDLIKFILLKQKENIVNSSEIEEYLSETSLSNKNIRKKNNLQKTEKDSKSKQNKKCRLNFKDMRSFAFKFMYIGKNYDGLVFQNHTKNTVEEYLLSALKKAKLIESFEKSNYSRCGRTDAGVSSTGNVFSVNLRYSPNLDYVKILNSILPKDICVIGMAEVDSSFDARFSCLFREYKYFFLRNNMNIEKIKQVCSKLHGVHNFRNFCKIDKSDASYMSKNYERRIFEFSVEKCEHPFFPHDKRKTFEEDDPFYELYVFTIKGSAFLWHQVRCMVGVIFLIGKGLEDIDIIDTMLDVSNNLNYSYEIASDKALVLSDCHYEFVNFENKKENSAESFLHLSNIYQENIIQTALNSYFLRTLITPLKYLNEEDSVKEIEQNYRRKNHYTKMLNHKSNRQNLTIDVKGKKK